MSNDFVFETAIQKRFSDFDMLQHVNNSIYPQYVEAARIDYFKKFIKTDLSKLLALTVEFQIAYVRPAQFEDDLAVVMRTKSIGNSSMVLEYEVINVREKSIVYARGEVKQVCCDARTLKPIRVPDETRLLVVELEGLSLDEAHLN